MATIWSKILPWTWCGYIPSTLPRASAAALEDGGHDDDFSCMGCKGVFFFSILWCSWSGDHPYDDLARFGYILDMKVEKKLETFKFLFLATYWNFSWKSGDLDSIFVGTWRIWVLYFSTWKILSVGRNHNFQVKIWWNFAKQKHWVCTFPNHSSKQVTYRGHRERERNKADGYSCVP